MFSRKSAVGIVLTIAVALAMALMPGPAVKIVHAQFVGAAQVPGFAAAATNAVTNAAVGAALAVTNPASNFIVLVQGGPVFCNGALAEVGTSTIQLAASTTYLIVANCAQQNVYAKTAVTGPGSPSSVSSVGTPATVLAPIPGLEVSVATVVCNATACGNGGNGSITASLPASALPGGGTPLNFSTFANLPTSNVPDGTLLMCSSCTQPTAGSATCTSGAANVLAARVAATWRCY